MGVESGKLFNDRFTALSYSKKQNEILQILSSFRFSRYSFETYGYDKQGNVGSLMFEKMEHRKFRVTATSISSLIAARNIGENKRRNGRSMSNSRTGGESWSIDVEDIRIF